MELEIQTMQPGERLYAYRQSTQLEGQTGGIGRLRGDFGRNGREFFTTWEDGHGRYKTDAFRQEFDRVVNTLRQPGGLFSGRSEMARTSATTTQTQALTGTTAGNTDFGSTHSSTAICCAAIPIRATTISICSRM